MLELFIKTSWKILAEVWSIFQFFHMNKYLLNNYGLDSAFGGHATPLEQLMRKLKGGTFEFFVVYALLIYDLICLIK